MSEYPWYTIVKGGDEILQGDFIPDCPILVPPANLDLIENINVECQIINTIILSQSCDLVNDKIDIVLVCPYISLKDFLEGLPEEQRISKRNRDKVIDNLRKGNIPGYHLINREQGILDDYQVVDFRNVYGIHIGSLKELFSGIKNRIRLMPPYREHLSQSFARYFMRVGLPQDISIEGY